MVAVAASVVVVAVGYTFAWQPMTVDITRLQRDLPRSKSVLAAVRGQGDSVIALERSAAPVKTLDPLAAVERVIAERGLRPMVSVLDVQEGRVRLTFASIRFDAIAGLLDALARTAGVRAADATLTQRVEPGLVRAEFALVR